MSFNQSLLLSSLIAVGALAAFGKKAEEVPGSGTGSVVTRTTSDVTKKLNVLDGSGIVLKLDTNGGK